MPLLLLGPTFGGRETILGVPVGVIVVGVALVGAAIGMLVMRRLTTIEGEAHSFRAIDGSRPRNWLLLSGLALAALALGLAWLTTR